MNTVFIDESGASGITDWERQPVFSLSALCIQENDAVQLCNQYLPTSISVSKSELKHNKLVRKQDDQILDELLALQRHLLNNMFVRSYVVDKRYFTLLWLAQNCIPAEDARHNMIEFFAYDVFRRWSDLIQIPAFARLLTCYQRAIVQDETDIKRDLDSFIVQAAETISAIQLPSLTAILDGIANRNESALEEFMSSIGKLDMVSVCTSGLVCEIFRGVARPTQLIYDRRTDDREVVRIFEGLTNNIQGDMTLTTQKSQMSRSLQLADILAGGARMAAERFYGVKSVSCQNDRYSEELLTMYQEVQCMMYCPDGHPMPLAKRIALNMASGLFKQHHQ